MIVPASGCSLLFTGFASIGFAFAAIIPFPGRGNTGNNAIAFYGFHGFGILMTLMAALPLQCSLTRLRLINAAVCGTLGTIAFVGSTVFGILENYDLYDLVGDPNGGALFFLSWVSAVLSILFTAMLTMLACVPLCYDDDEITDESINPPIPAASDVEAPKKKVPKSRADLYKSGR